MLGLPEGNVFLALFERYHWNGSFTQNTAADGLCILCTMIRPMLENKQALCFVFHGSFYSPFKSPYLEDHPMGRKWLGSPYGQNVCVELKTWQV